MRSTYATALLPFLFTMCGIGQLSSSTEKTAAQVVRSKYYNLEASGFQGMKCSVDFDFSTVPFLSPNPEDPTRKLIQKTSFSLQLDEKGRPVVQHQFPGDSNETDRLPAMQVSNLLLSFIEGVFNTWPTKGLQGPIPPFDSQIETVATQDDGYMVNLRVPGAPVQVKVDRNYLVTSITSNGGKLIEHPHYASSDEGLVFAGNQATDRSAPSGPVEVKYELGVTVLSGLRIPTSVHLQVNENIDVRYALKECSVKKGTVVHLNLPRTSTHP